MNIIADKAWAYFRFRLDEMKVLLAINCLIAAGGFPFIAVMLVKYTHLEDVYANPDYLSPLTTIVPLAAVGTVLLAFASGVSAFSHLHNKNICDMHLSLPLTHRQRFWVNFTVGALIATVPFILSYFVGLGIYKGFADEKVLAEVIGVELSEMGKFIGEYIFPVALTVLVTLIMTFALTVFCNTLCGSGFSAIFTPLLFSGVVPILILTLSTTAISNARGIDSIGNFPYIISTPLGFAAGSVGMLQQHNIFTVNMPVYLVPVLLLTLGLIVGSFFLSKNVRAENIGRDFLYKSIYNVQQELLCLCVVSAFGSTSINGFSRSLGTVIPWAVFISFVVYALAHIVHYKGLHKIKSGIVKYAAMLLSSVLICVVLSAGNGFGAQNYIPSVNNIQGVRIFEAFHAEESKAYTVNSDIFPKNSGWSWDFVRRGNCGSDREWKSTLEEARRVHKLFLDNPNAVERTKDTFYYWSGEHYNVVIEYELKSGLIVTRNYYYDGDGIDMLTESGVLLVIAGEPEFNPDIYESFGV